MKKINLVILAAILSIMGSLLTGASLITAQEADEVKESIKERLENSIDEKIEKVKGVLEETDSDKFYAYLGKITAYEEEVLTLKQNDQEKKIVIAGETTLVFEKKNIESGDIETEWFALTMGKVDENGLLQAQRIVFSEESPLSQIERQIVFGKIAEIDNKKITLKNHEEVELTFGKNTELKISGVDKPELADINVEDKAVAVLRKDKDGEYILKALFVWPGAASPESEENQVNATQSAETEEAEKPTEEE